MTPRDGRSDRLLDLQRFEARSSPNGLLLRYCAARPRHLAARQAIAVVAGLTFMALESAWAGAAILVLCVGGDFVDSVFCARIARAWRDGILPPRMRIAIRLSGALQALTIAVSAALAWAVSEDVRVEFYVTAFLVGAVINAGLIRPFDPKTGNLKLAILAGTWALLNVKEAALSADLAAWFAFQAYYLVASAMLAFASFTFLRFVDATFAKRKVIERDLLRNQLALQSSQAALIEREAQARRLAVVAEQASDSIFICDRRGRIEWVNDMFTRVTGYTRDEAVGQAPGVLMATPDADPEVVAGLLAARAAARPHRAEVLCRIRDGRDIWMEVALTPIWNLDGTHGGTIQVERDMTDAKAREAALARANAEARAAAEAKSRFLATMSHEIRTPMNGVIGMADLLSRTSLTGEQRGYLDAIVESGEALLALINDILDLTKLQSGKVEIAAEPFDLAATVTGVTTLLGPIAARKEIALQADTGPPLWVAGDAGRVRQILLNLVGNAVKFTSRGGVSVRLSRDGAVTRIAVTDTGIGIAPERLGSIFDAFTQADGAITRAFGGTGLGLTISRMLAQAMGGEVSVTSAPGQGSTFTLSLPLRAAAPLVASDPETGAEWPPRNPIRVLMAEDNATNRLILARMIGGPGVTLDEVENGADAVAQYCETRPDLVVMDMQMPVMDGLTALRHLREIERTRGLPRCPVIVLTANAFREDERASFAADADAFQTKPVKRRVFLQQAAALIEARRDTAAFPAARGLA